MNARRDRLLRGSAQFWSACTLALSCFALTNTLPGVTDAILAIGGILLVAWCCHMVTVAAVNRFFRNR